MGMSVNLTPQLEELVREKVSSGMYNSASEVVREALRLLQEQDDVREARLGQLRRDAPARAGNGASAGWIPLAGRARQAPAARTKD